MDESVASPQSLRQKTLSYNAMLHWRSRRFHMENPKRYSVIIRVLVLALTLLVVLASSSGAIYSKRCYVLLKSR